MVVLCFSFFDLSAREVAGVVETHDRPLPDAPPEGWYFNRMSASRGLLNDTDADRHWKVFYTKPQADMMQAKVEQKAGGGDWTFAGEFHRFGRDVTLGAIYPPVIKAEYQPRIIGVEIDVLSASSPSGRADLVFSLQLKHEKGEDKRVITSRNWSRAQLLGGAFPKTFRLDIAPAYNGASVNTLLWQLDKASAGDTIGIGEIRLVYDMPELGTADEAMMIWLGQLLRCYNSEAKIVDDRINYESGDMENVTATGKLCKLLALAVRKGMAHEDAARELVAGMAYTILHVLPKGPANLLPHFTSGGGRNNLSEWSSGDTAYTLLDLVVALRTFDLKNELAEAVTYVKSIDWAALKAPNGGFYHGYKKNGELIEDTWFGFGTEMIGVLLAAHIGGVPGLMGPPPSDNGAGFIDETGYPITPMGRDRFGNSWFAARTAAGQKQIDWYSDPAHACDFYASNGLFGLSAGERPSGWDADDRKIYQAYGVGGAHVAPLYLENGHFVVVGHYHAMLADLRLAEALRMHNALISRRLLSPLNMLESMSVNVAGEVVHVNALQGSWNLALGAEGWLFTDSSLVRAVYQAMCEVPELAAAWRYYFPDQGEPDFDSDGLADQVEDELGTRWDHPDTDGDGLFDAEDPEPTVFNPPDAFPVLMIEPDTVRVEAGTAVPDLLQGVSAVDGDGSDLTPLVQVKQGAVNVQVLGEYEVTYVVTNEAGLKDSGDRKYVVSDTTPPLLRVTPDFVHAIQGADLNLLAGVQAMDSFEGDLTAQVVRTGEVDSATPGEYEVVYNVADSSGNAAQPRSRRYLVSEDSDGDDLPDAWEQKHFGHLRFIGTDDPDADGQDNLAELAAGTDPCAYVISLRAGWNLVSVSKLPRGADFTSVFTPGVSPVASPAWRWDSEQAAYVSDVALSPFEGIWVFTFADTEITVRP